MSYPHGQQEAILLSSLTQEIFSTTATGKKAVYRPTQYPVKIRGVAVQIVSTGTLGATNAIISFRYGSNAGAAQTTTLVNVTMPSGAAIHGRVYYKRAQDQIINPGEELAAYVATASTVASGRMRATVLMEPVWEQPANNSKMYAAT